MWANVKHLVDPEKIFVYIEYLADGKIALAQLTPDDLESVRGKIRESVADMADYIVDGDIVRNEPVPKEEWDLTPDRGVCRRCNFYELCEPEFED